MTGVTSPLRILIVDDHPLLREGLRLRLELEPEFTVCGEAATIAEAVRVAQATQPDLATIDLALEDGNGLDLIRQLSNLRPDLVFVVISAYDDHLFAERAVRAGAMAYVNKRDSGHVVEALKMALSGQRWLSPSMASPAPEPTSNGLAEPTLAARCASLSNRELEVLTLIGQGCKSGQIATRLSLSINTVDTYRAKLKDKLGAQNSAELSRMAVQWVLEGNALTDGPKSLGDLPL
jgi:DNA-binding NarL/FixJ family response regulator